MQQGSAGLVEVLPWIGPAWVSAGAQTLSLPSRLRRADVPLLGAVASSCFAVSVRPEQFKPLLCYLNPSSLATASSLCRGVCMCYRFQLITSVGVYLLVGWAKSLHCGLPVPVPTFQRQWLGPVFGSAAPAVPAHLSGPFFTAQPEPGVLFSPGVMECLDIKVKRLWASQFTIWGLFPWLIDSELFNMSSLSPCPLDILGAQ